MKKVARTSLGKRAIRAVRACAVLWAFALAGSTTEVRAIEPKEGTLRESATWDPAQVDVAAGAEINPDLFVLSLLFNGPNSPLGYGNSDGVSAFAFGTVSCNLGTTLARWQATTNMHPVIAQHMYRLKNGRFEQIGISWLKHGFLAVNDASSCGNCEHENQAGSVLWPGCSDPYGTGLNANQLNLGPRWQVDANTGYFPFPPDPAPPLIKNSIDRRLQVKDEDLDPALNAGALYFAEGHYVSQDDSTARNQNNNASYQRILVAPCANQILCRFGISQTGSDGIVGESAIRAWKNHDPSVLETDIQLFQEGLYVLSAKATDLGTGYWRYEYALYNMNSDRSAQSFSIPIPDGALVGNIGFHDVDYHSGDPYDGTDWPGVVAEGAITWATVPYATNENANALRWGTLYNFRFDINTEPSTGTAIIGLFKPGFPTEARGVTVTPLLAFIDCNRNTISDVCDVDCGPPGGECDIAECGESHDCNTNQVPDECEDDCNQNGTADDCDLAKGTSPDCNGNRVPDDCEPDCDDDGIPDSCDGSDADGDGIIDCDDLCPETTPPPGCLCPTLGECCFDTFCLPDYPACDCESAGGIPSCECEGSLCRSGCLPADGNGDGRRNLPDVGLFQSCFTGPRGRPGFVEPGEACVFAFDLDDDGDIDLVDYEELQAALGGP